MKQDDQLILLRIARLERELAEIKQMLTQEPEASPSPPEPAASTGLTPPPVQTAEPRRPEPRVFTPATLTPPPGRSQPVRTIPSPRPAHINEESVPLSSKQKFDIEMLIGGRYMTYAGAGLVVIAMVLLVTYAISKGLISAQLQWGGELALSAAFIGLGLWKVNEKEGFGQVLAATGLTGLYLSFAGAHFYKQIITYEGVMAAFTALSIASYGFSEWRGSKPFFVIGLTGGLLAAGMGFKTLPPTLPLLHGLTLAPALAILFRRKWMDMAYLVWPSTLLFGLINYALLKDSQWYEGLTRPDILQPDFWSMAAHWAPYSLFGLAASAAYLKSHEDTTQEGGPLVAWFGPMTACLAPLIFLYPDIDGPAGFGMIALLAAGHWAIARLGSTETARKGQELGALAALLFAPAFALTLKEAALVFSLEAVALAVVYQRKREFQHAAFINILAGICLLASATATFNVVFEITKTSSWTSLDWLIDSLSPLIASAALCLMAGAMPVEQKEFNHWDWHGMIAALLAGRAFYSLLQWSGQRPLESLAWAGIAVLFISAGAAWGRGSRDLLSAFFVGVLAALIGTASLPKEWHVLAPNELLPSVLIIAGSVLYAASYAKHMKEQLGWAAAGASLVSLYPFGRLAYLSCLHLGADRSTAVLTGLALFGLICAGLGRWKGWAELSAAGFLYGCASLAPYLAKGYQSAHWLDRFARNFETAGLLLLSGIIGFIWSHCAKSWPSSKGQVHAIGFLALGLPLVRVGYLYLVGPGFGVDPARSLVFLIGIWCILIGAVSVSKKEEQIAWSGLFYFIMAFFCGLTDRFADYPSPQSPPGVLAPLGLLLAASLVTMAAFSQVKAQRDWALGFSLPVNWALSSLIILEVAVKPPFGYPFDASLSGSWIIYGGIVLAIGLAKNLTVLRIGGLIIFGAAAIKVLFYDLAYLETMAKIAVFMGFGLLMLILSYGYVRFAQSHKPPEQE